MRVQHNIMVIIAYRNYTNNVSAMKKNLERLSAGYKINRAGDDAAGLAISEKMRAQITGLETAQKNAKDGISLVQTAEGALTEVHDMLNRMVELATQSANGTYDNTTDRDQLQKEVNQLLSEIDRIADSSNFNGIKLLDGTLGLNTDAFSFGTAAALAKSPKGDIDLSTLLSKLSDGPNMTHLELAAAGAKTPGATIDLNDFAITVSAKATAGNAGEFGKITLKLGDYGSITLSLTAKTSAQNFTKANLGTVLEKFLRGAPGGTAITEASYSIKAEIEGLEILQKNGVSAATANSATSVIKLGNAAYTVTNSSGDLTLTYKGRYDENGDFKAETTFNGTDEEAAKINKDLGFSVSLNTEISADTKVTAAITTTYHAVHDTLKVTHAGAKVEAGYAGIDLKLTADMIINKGSLTIDGVTFNFYTDKDDYKAAKTGGTDNATDGYYKTTDGKTFHIDLTDYADATDEERIHAAVDALSRTGAFTGQNDTTLSGSSGGLNGGTQRTWKITVKNDNTIHIEQYTKTNDPKQLIDTYDKLTKLISAKGEVRKDDLYHGTTITINEAELKEGNVLNIGGKKYMFSDKNTGESEDGTYTYVGIAGGAAENLKAQLEKDGDYVVSVKGDTVTVRAKTADDSAPVILGKGLTLQIGDTSDAFNQLNVAVQDCHTANLGIEDLDISSAEAAQMAIADIKTAINMVSDVRGTLGATQNRLDHTINNLSVMTENIQDAESTIRDTDIAEEMMAYTKNNILIQSAQAMLAQANQVPQGVLQLLQ